MCAVDVLLVFKRSVNWRPALAAHSIILSVIPFRRNYSLTRFCGAYFQSMNDRNSLIVISDDRSAITVCLLYATTVYRQVPISIRLQILI